MQKKEHWREMMQYGVKYVIQNQLLCWKNKQTLIGFGNENNRDINTNHSVLYFPCRTEMNGDMNS